MLYGNGSATNFVKPSKSITISGSSLQSLYLPEATLGSYNRQTFSVSIWIKPTAANTPNQCIIGKGDELTIAGSEWNIVTSGTGSLTFSAFGDSVSSGSVLTNNNQITSGTWQHLLLWFDSTNATAANRMRIFINGSEASYATRNNPPLNMTCSTSSKPLTLGKLDPARTLQYDGKLYQPALYNGLQPLSNVYLLGHPVELFIENCKTAQNPSSAVTNDDVLGLAKWTNQNSVTASVDIPT